MSEKQENLHLWNEWTKRASGLWTGDAQNVLSCLDTSDAVLVSGPNGSGKTQFLSPKIRELASGQQWQSAFLDTSGVMVVREESKTAFIDRFHHQLRKFNPDSHPKKTQPAVMILDEIGSLDLEDTTNLLMESKSLGYGRFVLIVAGTTEELREKTIARAQASLEQIEKTSRVYPMDQKVIPEDLSREYLELALVPRDVIDFVLPNFPRYLRVLDLFRGCKTKEDALVTWESHWMQRGASKDDYFVVQERLRTSK